MEVQYFEDDQGRQPAREFIDGLDPKMRAKVFGRLLLLEEYSERLPMPFARHLEDGIFEGWHLRAENTPRLEHHPPPLFLLCWQSRYRHQWLREKDSANAKKRNRACKEVQGDLEVTQ